MVTAQELSRKLPVPNDNEKKVARELVNDLLGEDIKAAKTVPKKIAVARNMMQTARATKDDPVGSYALLESALELAISAADLATADQAIRALADRYQVDRLEPGNSARRHRRQNQLADTESKLRSAGI